MTEDEKRQQKAMLLLQYEETRQELEHLRTKAWEISERVRDVARWLDESREMMGNSDDYRHKELESKILSNNPRYKETFDFDSLHRLREELRATNQKLRELAAQKKSLGLGS